MTTQPNSNNLSDPVSAGALVTGPGRRTRRHAGKPGHAEKLADAQWSSQLNLELLQIATAELSDDDVRTQLRLVASKFTGAIAVANVTSDEHGHWSIQPDHVTGKLPPTADLGSILAERCTNVMRLGTIQVDPLPNMEGCFGIFVPVNGFGLAPELQLTLLKDGDDPGKPMLVLEKLASILQVSLKTASSNKHEWKLNSLSAMIELVSQIENCGSVKQALDLVANEMARHLQVASVAIAETPGGRVRRVTVSGAAPISRRSSGYHAYQQCLSESLIREQQGVWPTDVENRNELLLAHRQLASELKTEAVLSQPLTAVDGKVWGAWLFTGSREQIQSERISRFVNATTPRVANALRSVRRGQHPLVIRAIKALPRFMVKAKTLICLLALSACVASMFVPVPYRVRCNCTVEPGFRRFAVAPFEGIVLQGYVRPGDRVASGQVLAEMDGRSIRYEMASVSAEHNKAMKQRAIELANRDIPEMMLAELESARLEAEQQLLDYRKHHLQIKSPIDGIVLSGSLERAELSAVQMGDVLFEIGASTGQLIQIEVPADEIAQTHVGLPVTIWIGGQENLALEGKIERIRPRSELRSAENVFIAELSFDAPDVELRPGMKGAARIDCEPHTLGWNLFHKPYDYVRSRLSW